MPTVQNHIARPIQPVEQVNCCPTFVGEVCWSDGSTNGRAFAIRLGDGSIQYIDQTGAGDIAAAFIVPCEDDVAWSYMAGAVTRVETSGAGVVAADAAAVTVVNVGQAAGVLNGVPLSAGETTSVAAYSDPVARRFVRVPAIPYDATGTVFHITRQA